MRRLITVLSVLLVLQLGLTAVLGITGRGFGAVSSTEPLLSFEHGSVDRIVIEVPDADPLILAKKDGGWRLPGHFDFPASPSKVEDFAAKLAGLQKLRPVATTGGAAKRFRVASDDFTRKVVLELDGSVVAGVYLGDSPGVRRVYARAEEEDAVYEVQLASHEASAKHQDWTDRTVLRIEGDIVRAELPGFSLARKDEDWTLEGLKDKETTDGEEAERVIRRLTNLSFDEVLGAEQKPEYKQDEPDLKYKLELESGDAVEHVFSRPEEGDDFVLKVSTQPYYFKVPAYSVEPLLGLSRDDLVQQMVGSDDAQGSQPATSGENEQQDDLPLPAAEEQRG